MLISAATLILLTLFVCVGVGGVLLLRQQGWQRWVGVVLVLEALLAIAAQVVLSTLPFGIGEPLIRVPFWQTLLSLISTIGAVVTSAALVYGCARFLLRLLPRLRQQRSLVAVLLLALPVVAGTSLYGLVRASTPERERERDPNKREITLTPGFQWSIYAQGTMDNPTAITFSPDGRLYIADIAGALWVATDANGDHAVDSIKRWADGFNLLVGLVWHEGELYTASSGKVEAHRDTDGDDVADQHRVVIDGLPSMVLMPHSNNGIAIGPDKRLYFGVGSTTNGEVENNELAAAILSVNPDGTDRRVYARGLGNSFDVAFNSDGALFGGDNSPSGEDDTDAPPDEFNYIVEGGHYGYPYFYGDKPENLGTRAPLATFPAHSAPTGVTFYSGDQYPPEFRDSGFITLWNRGEVALVEVAQTPGGNYLSRTSTFAKGMLYPIDVVTGPDGNLYVADFGTSAIYRITYEATGAR